VTGYNTMQEAVAYKEIENQIQPNLVIVHYWADDSHEYRVVGGYVVDIGNVSEEGGRLVVRAIPLPSRLNDLLLVHSRLYDMLNQVVVSMTHVNLPEDWTHAPSTPRGIASSVSTSPTICSSTTSGSSAEVTSPQRPPDPAPQVITHVRRRRGAIAAHRFEHLFESLGCGAGQLLHQKGKRGCTLADNALQHLWLTLHQCEINLRTEPLRLLPDGLLQIAP